MKKYLKFDYLNIFAIFIIWRVFIYFVTIIAIKYVPLASNNFLGGELGNYLFNPVFFSHVNFDGEHYINIATFGYQGVEQAFFPLYPKLIALFISNSFNNLIPAIIFGLIISHVCLLVVLVFLWKLIRIDFSSKIAYLTIICLLIFPTSFYFGMVYTESLFLMLSVLSFYFARKGNWWVAGIFGFFSSLTRIYGLLLFPALILEIKSQKKSFKNIIPLLFIPLGLVIYMIYLQIYHGDPLAFYNLQKNVGEQRQLGVTLLPQVWFRYVKILLTLPDKNFFYTTMVFEFLVGIAFFLLPIYGYFKKVRWSFVVYAMLGFLMPTVTGSLSSMPRYILVLFPSFLALAIFINKSPKKLVIPLILFMILWLGFETALFIRGHWVS